MFTKLIALAAGLVLALLFAGCGYEEGQYGNGEFGSRTVDVADQSALELTGQVDLEVFLSATNPRLEVSGDSNLIGSVETHIRDGVLVVGSRPGQNLHPQQPLGARLYVTELHEITLTGEGNLRVQSERAENFHVTIVGSGDVEMTGATGVLDATIVGGGSLRASQFRADEARVTIVGKGDAHICAEKDLTIELVGSGSLHSYCNPARIQRQIVGMGQFRQH